MRIFLLKIDRKFMSISTECVCPATGGGGGERKKMMILTALLNVQRIHLRGAETGLRFGIISRKVVGMHIPETPRCHARALAPFLAQRHLYDDFVSRVVELLHFLLDKFREFLGDNRRSLRVVLLPLGICLERILDHLLDEACGEACILCAADTYTRTHTQHHVHAHDAGKWRESVTQKGRCR